MRTDYASGAHKQVAASLPGGPAVMLRRAGAPLESREVNAGTRSSNISVSVE